MEAGEGAKGLSPSCLIPDSPLLNDSISSLCLLFLQGAKDMGSRSKLVDQHMAAVLGSTSCEEVEPMSPHALDPGMPSWFALVDANQQAHSKQRFEQTMELTLPCPRNPSEYSVE